MPDIARSSDEVPIAFERSGDGPPLIIVDCAIAYRGVGPSANSRRSSLTASPSTATTGAAEVRAATQPLLRMRMRGLEPPRTCIHTDLNRARLPIPPHPPDL